MAFHILIREAQPDDACAVVTAMRGVMAEPGNTPNAEELTPNEQEEHDFITSLTENENTLMLVAENFVHGEIVGVLTCMGDTRISRRHNADLGVLVMQKWRAGALVKA